jgi:hypothetical protein
MYTCTDMIVIVDMKFDLKIMFSLTILFQKKSKERNIPCMVVAMFLLMNSTEYLLTW